MKLENVEEYDDPILYDLENDPYTADVPFLLKWAATVKGPIIDVACGTGRATIPLAKKGHQLIGIDIHTGMLQEAKKKASTLENQIEWVEQDCTNFNLSVKSNLIYTVGNSFQHFLTNEAQDGLLASVYRHLEMGGIFIFGTRFPNAEELLQPPTEEYWRTYINQQTQQKVDVYTLSEYDALSQVQHYTTFRKTKDDTGKVVDEKTTNIRLRYVFPQEMARLLSTHGFEILHVYSDWQETPISNTSTEMVYVCRKR